jgi:hypothetical protein
MAAAANVIRIGMVVGNVDVLIFIRIPSGVDTNGRTAGLGHNNARLAFWLPAKADNLRGKY